MTHWLLSHSSVVLSYALLGVLGAAALWEALAPRRPARVPAGPRWWQQFALTALGFYAVRLCFPVAALGLAFSAEAEHWGVLNQLGVSSDSPASVVIGVMVIDLANYVQHRLTHALPVLWRLHQVHHCDLEVDCGTAIRHHPVETLVSEAYALAVIAALGISPASVLCAQLLGTLIGVMSHCNASMPRSLEAWLRTLIVTPEMHRIHHSTDADDSNRNFANVFSWWDRLFRSYRATPLHGERDMALGLGHLRSPAQLSLWKLLVLPLQPLDLDGVGDSYSARRVSPRSVSKSKN